MVNSYNSFHSSLQNAVEHKSSEDFVHYDPKTSEFSFSNEKANSAQELLAALNSVKKMALNQHEKEDVKKDIEEIKNIVLREYGESSSQSKTINETAENVLGIIGHSDGKRLEMLRETQLFDYFGRRVAVNKEEKIKVAKEAGLSDFQAEALYLYSTQAYRILNPFMRNNDVALKAAVKDFQVLLKEFNAEIKGNEDDVVDLLKKECEIFARGVREAYIKLPKFQGDTFRGDVLSKKELERMQSGKYIDNAVMSFSKTEEVGKKWALRDKEGWGPDEVEPAFITVIDSKSGGDIARISAFGSEDEVTFPPETEFEVLRCEKDWIQDKYGDWGEVWVIELKEVE